ncbi:hypothetical protein GGH94_005059 [Coemansia aciculifera]|uniref:Uncharacterized protein n=1 Tax=Coemansia aciculifera TaxID=417176 RepID=A0A9W8IGN4_9FUNG|nr:hypothetical protein GGH94_005059 [Coemansia aciculifera]
MHYVRVELNFDSEPNFFGTNTEYMQFVLSIGPSAPVRTVFDRLNNPAMQSILSVLGEYTSIQVLKLGLLRLSLWEVIALVKSLPLLSDLYTSIPAIEQWPTGAPKHKRPAYVIANYAPTGERFRCWHIVINSGNRLKNFVRCVLLLALICPNFDYAAVDVEYRENFMMCMNNMITTDGFRPHATRLRRLLFGGWRNEILSDKTIKARNMALISAARARMNGQSIEDVHEE